MVNSCVSCDCATTRPPRCLCHLHHLLTSRRLLALGPALAHNGAPHGAVDASLPALGRGGCDEEHIILHRVKDAVDARCVERAEHLAVTFVDRCVKLAHERGKVGESAVLGIRLGLAILDDLVLAHVAGPQHAERRKFGLRVAKAPELKGVAHRHLEDVKVLLNTAQLAAQWYRLVAATLRSL